MNNLGDKGIQISPEFYAKDWNDLDLSRNNLEDWNTAIKIFKDRIEGRYFEQIKALDRNEERKIRVFSGFAIMSLACLLIETLEQFWTGNIETSRNSIISSKQNWLYRLFFKETEKISNDAMAFYSFFQRSDEFRKFFYTEERANVFYTKFRCGLLHQGQTKGKSLIHIRKGEPMLR